MDYNQELLFTPEGVRDLYGEECVAKLAIQNRLHQVLKCYGFADIETPGFEFFDIFNRERGTVSSQEMFKFFDRNNNTLVLRPDITPSIARCVAKYYKEETFPIRLCYTGNTYMNHSSYQGRLTQVCQVGAELINDSTSDADAEIIALTIESLKKAGLKEFQVDIGHAEFFSGLTKEAGLSDQEIHQIKELLENKNRYGVENLLVGKNISDELKEIFIHLPELFGGKEHLEFAKSHVKNEQSQNAIKRLETLYDILDTYGLADFATLDLGMLNHYDYYTGIIFKAYTYGSGEAVATGGRYDNLIQQFGKEAPAVGVAIVLDQLMTALSGQNINVQVPKEEILILYRSANRKTAIALGNQLREEDKPICLMRMAANKDLEAYKSYAKQKGICQIHHINGDDSVQIIDIEKE